MRFAFVATAILVAGVLSGGPAHAGLLGDTVDAVYYYPDTDTVYDDEGTATVTPVGAMFTFPTLFPDTFVTVTESQVIVSFDGPGNYESAVVFNGVIVMDETSADISDVVVDAATTLLGFDPTDVGYTSNTISINLLGLTVPTGTEQIVLDVLNADVGDQPTVSAPEPVSLSLLATGLAGLGLARRRKLA